MSKEVNWQEECLKKGFEYVREPDDHYVIADPSEMAALLRDLLGVDVRTKDGDSYGVAVCELQEQQPKMKALARLPDDKAVIQCALTIVQRAERTRWASSRASHSSSVRFPSATTSRW